MTSKEEIQIQSVNVVSLVQGVGPNWDQDFHNNVPQNHFQCRQIKGLQFQLGNPKDSLVVYPHLLGRLCYTRHLARVSVSLTIGTPTVLILFLLKFFMKQTDRALEQDCCGVNNKHHAAERRDLEFSFKQHIKYFQTTQKKLRCVWAKFEILYHACF